MTNLTRRECLSALSIGAGALALPAQASASAPLPHTVFGVNAYGIFLSGLPQGGTCDIALIETLGRLGVPFARFPASAQWAGDWALFDADPQRYWSAMDTVFAAAEHSGVKLVPSVLWSATALPIHLGESMQAWCDPASKTSTVAKHYIEAFVARYDHSPALLMYEFCNELNDYVDDPKRLSYWPKPDQTIPGRKPRPGDLLTSDNLRTMAQTFAGEVRTVSRRPIGMGSNVPRGWAWHMARGERALDTRAQFIEQLRVITPPMMNVLSIHFYNRLWPWPLDPTTADGVLGAFVEAAAADGRIAFLGEFGVARMADPGAERSAFDTLVSTIKGKGIAYAAVWNVSSRRFQASMDIIPGGDRGYQLDAILRANRLALLW